MAEKCPKLSAEIYPKVLAAYRATTDRLYSTRKAISFNPRPRTGSDFQALVSLLVLYVSIHAPARGATWRLLRCHAFPQFQSTPPHGERLL